MIHIVILLAAIVLSSYFLLSGTTSINTRATQTTSYIHEIELAMTSFSSSVDGYRLAKGFSLPENDWEQALKEFDFMPVLSFPSEWHYSASGGNKYVCLSAMDGRSIVDAFNYLEEKYPSQYMSSNECQVDVGDNEIILSHKIK